MEEIQKLRGEFPVAFQSNGEVERVSVKVRDTAELRKHTWSPGGAEDPRITQVRLGGGTRRHRKISERRDVRTAHEGFHGKPVVRPSRKSVCEC